MREDHTLHVVEPQAWRTSAWAILQGSLDHQAARAASFDYLFLLGWWPVYATARLVHDLDANEARERVVSVFLQLVGGSTRRDVQGVRYRPYLKAISRDIALERRPRPPGAAPERWLEIMDHTLVDAEDRLHAEEGMSLDALFDREFATSLLEEAVERFWVEVRLLGDSHWEQVVQARFLDADTPRPGLRDLAADLGLREDQAARLLYKARQRLRRHAVLTVRATLPPEELDDPGAVDQELSILANTLRLA